MERGREAGRERETAEIKYFLRGYPRQTYSLQIIQLKGSNFTAKHNLFTAKNKRKKENIKRITYVRRAADKIQYRHHPNERLTEHLFLFVTGTS